VRDHGRDQHLRPEPTAQVLPGRGDGPFVAQIERDAVDVAAMIDARRDALEDNGQTEAARRRAGGRAARHALAGIHGQSEVGEERLASISSSTPRRRRPGQRPHARGRERALISGRRR
jgi:hypothetical protein